MGEYVLLHPLFRTPSPFNLASLLAPLGARKELVLSPGKREGKDKKKGGIKTGEYAIRKSDNTEIKIGICETMLYLRLEDKDKVSPCQGSGYGHLWRLPFPDEDEILPGDYETPERLERLYNDNNEDFEDLDVIDDCYIHQIRDQSGLLINVKCHHGLKLPTGSEDITPFWNGKSWFFGLKYLRTDKNKVWPVVACKHCGKRWRYEWSAIIPYLHGELKYRLEKYFHDEKIE